MKYLLLTKLSSESVIHQLSKSKTRSYWEQFVDYIYVFDVLPMTH